MNAWWSWLLTIVGVTGLYFAGRRRALGWAIGLGAQALWLAYAISTRQWGFLASAGGVADDAEGTHAALRGHAEVVDGSFGSFLRHGLLLVDRGCGRNGRARIPDGGRER